jgi:hypothetical protein
VGKKGGLRGRVGKGRVGKGRVGKGVVDVYMVDEDRGLERFFWVDPKGLSGSEKRGIVARI